MGFDYPDRSQINRITHRLLAAGIILVIIVEDGISAVNDILADHA
jgi:hypothetical protein